jgi:hypothetical protein
MGIPEYGFEVHWTKKHRYVSWFPIQHSFATLAKILEEITLFVALESKVSKMRSFMTTNLKVETLLRDTDVHEDTHTWFLIQRPVSIV